ncbi:MAG: sodium:proton antiporter, partial [Rhodospirillaceae bacterium]|nr:sodium:proton antiporter [Rhodospirillaceae bacterium]
MSDLSLLHVATVIVTLAALFGYINHRWLGLPHAIGIVVIALLASLGAIALDAIFPAWALQESVRAILSGLDFHDVLMNGMLSFLLFAGALHVNLGDLLNRKWAIGSMATVGVLMSTFMVGFAVYGISSLLGIAIPLTYCLVFGALIAPTDPVAVLGILKTVKVPESLEAKIAGESLF